MAAGPWRCSQCGTINEPVANSCRTCGKWPSLFDLEDSALEDDVEYEPMLESEPEPDAVEAHRAPEPMTVEVETFEPEPVERPRRRFEPPPTDPVLGEGEGQRGARWVQWLVPLAFVAYLVISVIFSNR
jgi:predicted ATP-dependent serine protease